MRLALLDSQVSSSKEQLPEQSIAYWKEKLQDVSNVQFPLDYPRPVINAGKRTMMNFSINGALTHQLLILSQKQETTLFITLLSVFKVMLFRYSAQSDICVGVVTDSKQNVKGSGVDYRLMALRSHINGESLFTDLLYQLDETVREALENEMPFGTLLDEIDKDRDLHNNPLFRQTFIFQDVLHSSGSDDLNLSESSGQHRASDIAFSMIITPAGLQCRVEYNTNLYKQETVRNIWSHYLQLLHAVVNNSKQKVGALPILTSEEEHSLIKFNNTITEYSKKKTLSDLFEDQVLKAPDHIALMQGNLMMSYLELNQHANRLARYLILCGVKKGDNVGLLVTRTFNMVTGMYAILKAGAAYVPIDPEYPLDRQKYILSKSAVDVIITDDDYPLTTEKSEFRFINFNTIDLTGYDSSNPGVNVSSTQLAYTIYTSGSTGLPKGVMIEHHSAVNLIEWVNRQFNVGARDRLLFITSMCFDLSVYDIFGMLAAGGSVVIAQQHEVIDVSTLKRLLKHFKITFWDSVPTTMNYLVQELISEKKKYKQTSLRLVFMSGDWIPVHLPQQIRQYFPKAEVISLGGATEATVWSNFYPVKKVQSNRISIPYGKPIANNFFYVLNEQLQHVPPGVAGELYIGGVGVARGYANDKEKTSYAFIKDPFNDTAGGRMYRTGDLGRMLPDGNLEFLGRKDNQVKIRGYRVELGEIESVLNQCKSVNQAVVVAKTDKGGNRFLVAYILASGALDREAVRNYLKSKLPEYMIPALLVELKQLPLTFNGKIDKKALSALDISEPQHSNYEEAFTENQRKLVAIWKEILGVEKVGIHDNFFELGGHSLIAVSMVTRFEKEIGIKLPLAILFKYPTISSLVSFIEKGDADVDTSWKSLVPIKSSGTRMPIYIIHGSGLNVLSFSDIAMYVDADQPVFGLQAKGLNGVEEPLDDMQKIAESYVLEILEHNPSGPYAIAGYSFGGYVAVEMARQLELMGRKVKMLAIFDTNAVDAEHYKLSKKIKRQFPKLLWFIKSLISQPVPTISYQRLILKKNLTLLWHKIKKSEVNDFYSRLDEITQKHNYAFRRYNLTPFNDLVYLFRARQRIYFVDDFKYLGWHKYAKKGVKIYEVPGDHKTMLQHPNARDFARALQHALDNC